MRAKFVPDFHECLRKAGMDEDIFVEAIQYLLQEYGAIGLRETRNKDNSEQMKSDDVADI